MPAIKSTGSNPKGPLFQIDNILDGETVHQVGLSKGVKKNKTTVSDCILAVPSHAR